MHFEASVSELMPSRWESCGCEWKVQWVFWRFTFAVGIWTAIDGVGSRPGAEGCMAGGCMGLKAPCENIHETQNKKKEGINELKNRAAFINTILFLGYIIHWMIQLFIWWNYLFGKRVINEAHFSECLWLLKQDYAKAPACQIFLLHQ